MDLVGALALDTTEHRVRRRLVVLEPSARQVTLTDTGRAFAAECRRLVAAARHAQEVATQAESGLVGTLRIGVVTSALSEPLLGALAAFRQACPGVDVQLADRRG